MIHHTRSSGLSPVKPKGPINVYVCTRRPPPAKELDLFVLRQSSSSSGWFSSIAPQVDASNSDDDILDRIKLYHLPIDLTSPSSIRACAKSFLEKESKLDFLLLNAAVAPKSRKVTNVKLKGEPVEEALMTNVLGHALLTESLKSAFHERGSERSTRVVTVSSELHRRIQETGKSFSLPCLAYKQRMNCNSASTFCQSRPILFPIFWVPRRGTGCEHTMLPS